MAKKRSVDPLAPAREKPKSVKSLFLNPAALGHMKIEWSPAPSFPREIFACTNLESLEIFRGIAWDGDNTIPREIGRLRKLRKLTLGGLSMKTLPDTIGELRALRELSLDYDESLTALPASIGKLSSLEQLSLGYCEELKAIPPSIGKLKKLKGLSFSETSVKKVPVEIWNATSLESLGLPEGVTSLPPGISKLKRLKSLFLTAKALASIAKELPALTALESIGLHQGEEAELPEEIGRLPRLETLHVAYAGLSALPASLAGHRALRDLDVAGNKLRSLEALAASLPKLKALDFSGNPLPRDEKRRIDAMMKKPPSQRKANAPLAPKPKGPKPIELGRVMSLNASIVMVVGDARTIAKWNGEEEYEGLCDRIASKDATSLTVGGKKAAGVGGIGQGVVTVYRVGELLACVEGFIDDWKDASFLEDLAAPIDPKAKPAARFPVDSGKLTLLWGPCTVKDADDGEVLTVKTKPGDYELLVEEEKNASWGSARRVILRKT